MECISSEEAMKKVKSGEVLLVCSYGDEKCKSVLFEGMLLSSEFEPKLGALSKTQEIIFYCSCPNDGTSASLAESYEAKRASQR
jgi:hypothetical protein